MAKEPDFSKMILGELLLALPGRLEGLEPERHPRPARDLHLFVDGDDGAEPPNARKDSPNRK